jgi:uncharacterized phiE125 gp8 family phage protein
MAYAGYSGNPYAAPAQPAFVASLLSPVELVTAPASGARVVSLEEFKTGHRVQHDTEDAWIDRLSVAATNYVENEIRGGRQLIQATFDVRLSDWWEGPLRMPRPPLASVTSVKYFDSAGTEQTVSSANYLVRTPWKQPGTVERAPGFEWPTYQADRREPVTIRFVAGYASGSVPETLKQACHMLMAHWYENHEPYFAAPLITPKELTHGVERFLEQNGWGSYA